MENMVANEVKATEESKVKEINTAELAVLIGLAIGVYEGGKVAVKKIVKTVKEKRADRKAVKLEKKAEQAANKVESE